MIGSYRGRTKKGMTLIELLIGIAVFAIFSLALVNMVFSTSKSYARGKIGQQARQQTALIIKNLQQDISSSMMLPDPAGSIGVDSPLLPSAVLLPNPYGVENGNLEKDKGNGLSEDHLVLVMGRREVYQQNLTDPVNSSSPSLRYIEYIVPENEPNKLYRKIYPIAQNGDVYNGFLPDGSGMWILNEEFRSGNLVQDPPEVIAELPGGADKITFTVQRSKLPEKDLMYNVDYDRYLFEIKAGVKILVGNNKPLEYEEQTDATVEVKQ